MNIDRDLITDDRSHYFLHLSSSLDEARYRTQQQKFRVYTFFITTGTMKAMLLLGVKINFYSHFGHSLSHFA
jgi:hypothetical protein